MFRMLLATAGLMFAAAATPAIAAQDPLPRTLSLTGHGEVRLAPDLAVVSAGVVTGAATAAEALAANAAAMQAVFAALTSAGIAEKDIQTSNFSVQPRYDYNRDGQPPLLMGYDVANTVTVTLRKIDGLGAVLDQLVTAGANQIQGVQFAIASPQSAEDEARKLAVADARRKAEIYAAAGNVAIGNVISIAEGPGYEPPRPMMRAKMAADSMAAETPIAAGEQTVSVDVSITWEIN